MAAARLIGRESLPLARDGVAASTPALARQTSITTSAAVSAAGGVNGGRRRPSAPASSGTHGHGCGCSSDQETSSERAFAVTTAAADWGILIARWDTGAARSPSSSGTKRASTGDGAASVDEQESRCGLHRILCS